MPHVRELCLDLAFCQWSQPRVSELLLDPMFWPVLQITGDEYVLASCVWT